MPLRAGSVVPAAGGWMAVLVLTLSCAPARPVPVVITKPATVSDEMAGQLVGAERIARIALAGGVPRALVSATAAWRIDEEGGRVAFVQGTGGEPWRIEQRGNLLRIAGEGSDATPWRRGPLVARAATTESLLQYGGKRYRGELWFTATDSGMLVVNRLPVEAYLRGVVPLELGTRQPTDRAALEAQAIAARTYTYARVAAPGSPEPARGWHMLASVTNQVYGGADVEHGVVDQAIVRTAGYVLQYAGRLIDAPYYSSCGGRTALPRDAWNEGGSEPYLKSVYDTDPATGRPYCDLSPRNHWREELSETQVSEAVVRALQAQGAARVSAVRVREVAVGENTPTGRVGALVFRTDRGDVTVRARDIRNVLRDARGAILSSTYFSIERQSQSGGRLTGVVLRGHGNGHGVGMCQWGAIGRARAGQDARTILQFYYPGTTIALAD